MKRKFIIFSILFILLVSLTGCGKKERENEKENNKVADNGNIYPVHNGQKYGFINTNGDYIIEPQYDFALGFYEDVAAVVKDGKMGYINQKGETVIGFNYDYIDGYAYDTFYRHNFQNGIAVVNEGSKDNYMCYYIDKTGQKLFNKVFRGCKAFNEEGIAMVNPSYGVTRYINTKGEEVKIEEKKEENPNKDICIKNDYNYERSNYDYYYVNCNTNEQLWDEKYREASYFVNGLAKVVNQDRKTGIIDTKGQYIVKPEYHTIESFNEHNVAFAGVVTENSIIKYGLVDNKGSILVEPVWGNYFEYEDIYMFKENKKVLLTKKDGSIISEFTLKK